MIIWAKDYEQMVNSLISRIMPRNVRQDAAKIRIRGSLNNITYIENLWLHQSEKLGYMPAFDSSQYKHLIC